MDFPTPSDPRNAPAWENYVIAQAVQASLRLVPVDAYALGVEIEGSEVRLVIQAEALSPAAAGDIADILSDLEALLGPDVVVSSRFDRQDQARLSPHSATRWFYATRA